MTDAVSDIVDPRAQSRSAIGRLCVGLVQGLLLFGLDHAAEKRLWPGSEPALFQTFAALCFFTPFVVLAGISAMRWSRLAVWTAVAGALSAGLAAYAAFLSPPEYSAEGMWPQGAAVWAIAALLFIGHHLVQPADMERRPIARFATYFDETWKHGVQLALSILFTGAFWLLLFLAGSLFKLIGIEAIERLIKEPWFAWPATAVMFAAAVQLTDVRAGLVRGVRTVSLTLLAWLLPLMALIAGGFLLSLPFTGLAPLWATKKAAALLLTAAAFLIVLTNAAYQDGTERPPAVLAWAARIAGLLLAPITALAAYAIWLRIDQYGLTPERVYATACVVVAAGYAAGYAIAALKPGPWMKPLEPTNIAMAFVSIAVLLALFSPVADPVRLSVDSQLARLRSGATKPEAFDFGFLRYDSGVRGERVFAALEKDPDPAIARAAKAAPKSRNEAWERRRRDTEPTQAQQNKAIITKIEMLPKGQVLPEDFASQYTRPEASRLFGCTISADGWCVATLSQIDGAGEPELLLSGGADVTVYRRAAPGDWQEYGQVGIPNCPTYNIRDVFAGGRFKAVPPSLPDLEIAGERHHMTTNPTSCARKEPPPAILAPPPRTAR